ncbi:hypothetical protein H6G89_15925 [Oscillatoria sp. FACHB-1407]|uniref:hypothetical protein n=1 Tax=Oscillatoria sp. FACHB-1407 TaxID=2692847 RepID=UPI001684CC9B|nr:hypothetical protein [Oscillatoria sp. FACHB-1407]MBD2462534.1 hypothetical protein [Oscillatoria sp. FACHB-1407]
MGLRGLGLAVMSVSSLGLVGAIALIWHLDNWGITPERAARRDGYCEDAPQIKAQRQTEKTFVVVCQGMAEPFDGGHVIVSQMPWGVWWASPTGSSFSFKDAISTTNPYLIDYFHNGVTHSVHTTLMALGRVHSSEVVALEATLSNGRVLRSDVRDGLFVLDAPIQAIGVRVIELRAIGRDNRVLQRVEVDG